MMNWMCHCSQINFRKKYLNRPPLRVQIITDEKVRSRRDAFTRKLIFDSCRVNTSAVTFFGYVNTQKACVISVKASFLPRAWLIANCERLIEVAEALFRSIIKKINFQHLAQEWSVVNSVRNYSHGIVDARVNLLVSDCCGKSPGVLTSVKWNGISNLLQH